MQRDEQRGIASHNYYHHLGALLDYSGDGKPSGFDEITCYWKELVTWLNHDNFGQRGICTAQPIGRFSYIGWPLSQCLLRTVDRERLSGFFHFACVPPRAELDAHDLVASLERWCDLTTCPFPNRLRQLITRGSKDERLQIAEIVAGEARAWSGEIEEGAGTRIAPVVLRIDVRRHGHRFDLQLIPRRPAGFPTGPFHLEDRSIVLEAPEGAAWYEPLPIIERVDPQQVLTNGPELRQDRFVLRWNSQQVIVASSDPELGGYTSQPRAVFGQHCVVLCRSWLSPRVEEFLTAHAVTDWRKVAAAAGLPSGWLAYLDVKIQKPPIEIGNELRSLVPQQWVSVALEGGLKLGHQTWLAGGEPVLSVSLAEPTRIIIDVDGTVVHETLSQTAHVDLTSIRLSPGMHTVTVLSRSRRFQTVRASDYRSPRGVALRPASLGHVLVRTGSSYVATSLAAQAMDQQVPMSGEVRVIGAAVQAQPEDLPENLPQPVLLESGARRYLLIGSRPGMVFECRDPAAPPYACLREPRPLDFFEVIAPFQPVWLVRVSWRRHFSVRQVGPARPPEDEPWPPGETAFWSRLLRKRYARPPGGEAGTLWRRYQQAAGAY